MTSIALHKDNHEGSKRCVDKLTTVVRAIEVVMVMITSEKINARAIFLLGLIWEPHSMLVGINMTAPFVSQNFNQERSRIADSKNQSQHPKRRLISD